MWIGFWSENRVAPLDSDLDLDLSTILNQLIDSDLDFPVSFGGLSTKRRTDVASGRLLIRVDGCPEEVGW